MDGGRNSRTQNNLSKRRCTTLPPQLLPQDTNGRSFEDDTQSSRWNAFVTSTIQRRAGVKVGPSTLRSSFVTHLLGGDNSEDFGKVDPALREEFARAMRHSVHYVSRAIHVYYTCTCIYTYMYITHAIWSVLLQ